MFSAERPNHNRTARRLAGLALVDEYINLDEANRIYSQTVAEVLTFIARRIEQKGSTLQTVLKQWEMLDEALEYLNKTE